MPHLKAKNTNILDDIFQKKKENKKGIENVF